jgi:hypothetical protein
MQEPCYILQDSAGRQFVWSLSDMLFELNRDRSADWEPYTKYDWTEGWVNFIDPSELRIVGFHLR